MAESRSEKRKERYNELKALGFSSVDARKYRDRSGDNIERKVSSEQRRISRKPKAMRTSSETFKLRRIRSRKVTQSNRQRSGRMDSREARWRKFSASSKINKFPKAARLRILKINRDAGLSPDDRYGYRRYYFEYVERLDPGDASDLSDRGDSGMRYLANWSLVPGRVNLRRLIRPPKSRASKAS